VETFLANLALGAGYILICAAFMDGGKHATRPWGVLTA
jgi:hypothetical protein